MICQPLEGINYESIILNEAVKNSVLQYNYFYKLIYSTDILVLTSIFAIFELTNIIIENDIITFNKNNNNFDIFNKLIALEEYLLKLLNSSKTKLYKFKELYDNKSLRFVSNETSEMLENNINTINPINISSNQDQSKLTDRYSYIDNISKTPNNQQVGLLYQVIDDIMDLNPTEIFNSILEPPNSQCIPVTLKTIKQNMNYDIETGFETQYVIVSEIEKINPCNFSDGVNPFITEKTNAICDLKNSKQISIFNEYDTERKNITKETFSNITYPKNNLIQLYLFFVLILFFYLFYKLNYK